MFGLENVSKRAFVLRTSQVLSLEATATFLSRVFFLYGIMYSFWFLGVSQGSTMLRGFLIEAVYRKALRVHIEVAKATGSAKGGSMMALETEKILSRAHNVFNPLEALIVIPIGLVLLYKQIGLSFLATLIGVAALSFATPLLSTKIGPAQAAWSTLTDARQKVVTSALRQIAPLKLSGYAKPILGKLEKLRRREVEAVRLFTVIAILSTISTPLFSLGQAYAGIVAAWQSLRRIEDLLLSEEKDDARRDGEGDIVFSKASFGHGKTTFLHEVSTTIPCGKLSLIVGRVGSGKSTLLHACLGEVDLQAGSVIVPPAATAALDAGTESSVFLALFSPSTGLLSGRTVVLVTNGVHRLPYADNIVMLADGRIVEQGSYETLVASSGPTATLFRDFAAEHQDDATRSTTTPDAPAAAGTPVEEPLMEPAEDEGTRVNTTWHTYGFYLCAVGGWRAGISGLLVVVAATLPLVINLYQSEWSSSIGEVKDHMT
ncbi:hypothetical protein RQP46_001785 [Phenoliferia psychrophenolica]